MKSCDPLRCGYAHGGECSTVCLGLQLHRPVLMNLQKLEPAVIVHGNVERRGETPAPTAPLAVDFVLPDDGRLTLAIHTFKAHRAHGRRKALASALGALFRKPLQPANKDSRRSDSNASN